MDVTGEAAAMIALFLLLLVLERGFPLRRPRSSWPRRLAVDLLLSASAIATALVLVRPVVDASARAADRWHFGLLQWLALPPPLDLVAGVLLLDAAFYLWHLANHRLPVLWRFHVVHHIDPDLDVATAFRFHPGEVTLSAGFRFAQILLIGPSPWTVAIYELMFQANTLFHHSNVRLPLGIERCVNRVLVTPRMHGIHHSTVEREDQSNFSVVFCWWDRLFRTLRLNVPQHAITIGIPAYGVSDNAAGSLMMLPFREQRDPWRRPDGTTETRDDPQDDASPTRLA